MLAVSLERCCRAARVVVDQYPNEDADTMLTLHGTIDSHPHAELVDTHLSIILKWLAVTDRYLPHDDLVLLWTCVWGVGGPATMSKCG